MMGLALIKKVIVAPRWDTIKFAITGLNVFDLSFILVFVQKESKDIIKGNIVASFTNFKHRGFVWIIHWNFKEH